MNNQKIVFVGGVKACFIKQDIIDHFSKFGELTSVKIKKSKKKNKLNLGFCSIRFQELSAAQKVVKIKNHIIKGRVVTCREFLKGEKLKVSRSLRTTGKSLSAA